MCVVCVVCVCEGWMLCVLCVCVLCVCVVCLRGRSVRVVCLVCACVCVVLCEYAYYFFILGAARRHPQKLTFVLLACILCCAQASDVGIPAPP